MVKVIDHNSGRKEQHSEWSFYGWGAFWGWVLGNLFSKVYLLWAVWFRAEGHLNAGIDINNWVTFRPMWQLAFDYPIRFQIACKGCFMLASVLFVRFLLKIEKERREPS